MSTEKPTSIETSAKLTDTIVNSTQQNVKDAKPIPTSRAINAYGISIMRGGNVLGTSFIESIIDAYSNLLSYHPIAFILCFISVIYYLSKILEIENDPFLAMKTNVNATYGKNLTGPSRSITGMALAFFALLNNYKVIIAMVMAMIFPYLSKPSTKNAIISTVLSIYCFLISASALVILSLSQFFFLFVQLRDPKFKAIIALLVFIVIIMGHEYISSINKGIS